MTLLVGIAPEHAAAFVAGLVALVIVPFLKGGSRSTVDRWAAALLGYAAAVHLFLPLGHRDGALLTAGMLASGVLFAVLTWRAHLGRGWRIGTAILAPLTVLAYLLNGEDADQVGVLTALLELTAFGLAVATTRKVGRVFGSIGTVAAVFLAGAVIWVESFVAHQAGSTDSQSPSVGHSHAGQHEHLARAQAGVIMRPLIGDHHATPEQTAAAIALSERRPRRRWRRYAKLSDALAAGYRLPDRRSGPAWMCTWSILSTKRTVVRVDPERPEMLVYAIDGGKATLLGVVFVMERAGDAGSGTGRPDHAVARTQPLRFAYPARDRHRHSLRRLPLVLRDDHDCRDDAPMDRRATRRPVRRRRGQGVGERLPPGARYRPVNACLARVGGLSGAGACSSKEEKPIAFPSAHRRAVGFARRLRPASPSPSPVAVADQADGGAQCLGRLQAHRDRRDRRVGDSGEPEAVLRPGGGWHRLLARRVRGRDRCGAGRRAQLDSREEVALPADLAV